jgi:hypothetical protein
MDTQTKREIWLLTIGMIVVEVPVAIAAFAILALLKRSHGTAPARSDTSTVALSRRLLCTFRHFGTKVAPDIST